MSPEKLAELISRIQKNEVEVLELSGVDISDADAEALAEVLKQPGCSIKALDLKDARIGYAGVAALAEALKTNSSLQTLDLRNARIRDAGAAALAAAFEQPGCSIQALALQDNEIGAAGAARLAGALKDNSSLQTLDLSCNHIEDAGAAALAEALTQPGCSIKALNFNGNYIRYDGAVAFAEALKANHSLLMLNLSRNEIGDAGAKALAEALKQPGCSIHVLSIWKCCIGDAGVAALAEALKTNHSVQTLDLGYNKIGAAGAAALAEALETNHSVQTLVLQSNQIGDAGAIKLAEALKTNHSVQTLDLGCNKIGDNGAIKLAEALKDNSSLQTLDLRYNKIGGAGAAALAEALKKPGCSIKALHLVNSQIGEAGAIKLAEALKDNSSLQTLDLGDNEIGDVGAAALAEALETNHSVQRLVLQRNQIGDAGVAQKIKKELEANLFLNSLPTLGAAPRNFLEYQERCSTLRDIFFQTRAKYGISMSGQSSESVPNKILNFLSELEGEMCGTYGAFEDLLYKSKDATITEKKTAFRSTVDMLQCLLKPGGPPLLPLVRCIRYLLGEDQTTMDKTQLPLLSYRLLLEAASEVLPKLKETPALQSFVAKLLRQDAGVYNPVIAGQLMAIPEVMSRLGMAPVIASGAEVASLDGDGTQPVLIDCYVPKDSQPVVLQAAIITEELLVLSNSGLADLSMFGPLPAPSDKKEEGSPKP